jgi:hypothetical protein
VADFGTKVIFPRTALSLPQADAPMPRSIVVSPGDYVRVRITAANSETLKGAATAFTRLTAVVNK